MLLKGSGRSRWTDPRTDTRRGRRLQPPRLWAPRESLRPRLARNLRSAADASTPGDPDRSAALARGTGGRGGMRGSPLLDGLGGVIADGPAGAALASAPVSEDGRRCRASHAKPERLTTGARSRGAVTTPRAGGARLVSRLVGTHQNVGYGNLSVTYVLTRAATPAITRVSPAHDL